MFQIVTATYIYNHNNCNSSPRHLQEDIINAVTPALDKRIHNNNSSPNISHAKENYIGRWKFWGASLERQYNDHHPYSPGVTQHLRLYRLAWIWFCSVVSFWNTQNTVTHTYYAGHYHQNHHSLTLYEQLLLYSVLQCHFHSHHSHCLLGTNHYHSCSYLTNPVFLRHLNFRFALAFSSALFSHTLINCTTKNNTYDNSTTYVTPW